MIYQTVKNQLSRRHGEQNDYELVVPAALLKQQQQTQQIFTIVMSAIAGISLLVGGIGIMLPPARLAFQPVMRPRLSTPALTRISEAGR